MTENVAQTLVNGDCPGHHNCIAQEGGCLNPLDPQSMRLFTPDGAFHTVGARSNAGQHSDGVCIALDGDKLKPRIDQRKGGNGFGVDEEGAGYTLTGVDRHGVAYGIDQQGGKGGANTTEGVAPTVLSDSHGTPHGVAYCADGGEVAATITRQIAEQSGQDNRANAVVECYENHAQDSRIKPIEVSDTRNQKDGTGDVAPIISGAASDLHHTHGVISTNSNGEDVAPTISSCEYKMGQKQKDTGGGTSSPAARKERTMGTRWE